MYIYRAGAKFQVFFILKKGETVNKVMVYRRGV